MMQIIIIVIIILYLYLYFQHINIEPFYQPPMTCNLLNNKCSRYWEPCICTDGSEGRCEYHNEIDHSSPANQNNNNLHCNCYIPSRLSPNIWTNIVRIPPKQYLQNNDPGRSIWI